MGPDLLYLEFGDVLGIYADLFGYTEREAEDRLRSPDGLASALARPGWAARYGGTDIAHQAALLAHGIAEGQYFLEGNKRTPLVCLTAFLGLNAYRLTAPQAERFRWMVGLSRGGDPDVVVEELAGRIRESLVSLTGP
ncbi:MAG: Fic family protein [Chloroflexota bacterium]|nr:Fic family protein [Chloroflexota bacterium]